MTSADRPAEFLSTDNDNDNHSPFFVFVLSFLCGAVWLFGFLWQRIMRTDFDG